MLKLGVLSRLLAETNTPPALNHIIISIYTPEDSPPKPKTNKQTLDLYQIAFDDLDYPTETTLKVISNPVLFSQEMAKQIATFVWKYIKEIEMIICHCDAGISRSAGVAAALSQYYNGDASRFFHTTGPYCPNMRVYRILLNELQGCSI